MFWCKIIFTFQYNTQFLQNYFLTFLSKFPKKQCYLARDPFDLLIDRLRWLLRNMALKFIVYNCKIIILSIVDLKNFLVDVQCVGATFFTFRY